MAEEKRKIVKRKRIYEEEKTLKKGGKKGGRKGGGEKIKTPVFGFLIKYCPGRENPAPLVFKDGKIVRG